MVSQALVRRCQAVVDGLDVPSPLDLQVLIQRVGALRGRPIELVAKELPMGPCGVWVALPDLDVVVYEAGTSRVHRQHIVLHEVGHLLLGHGGSDQLDSALLRRLLPSLDVDLVERVLARTGYADRQEQEAELVASLIVQRAGSVFAKRRGGKERGRRPLVEDDESPVMTRLSDMLGTR